VVTGPPFQKLAVRVMAVTPAATLRR
jgi:hypothetical protein